MDGSQRRSALLDRLRRDGRVEVADAARSFGTAEMTVRRDLDALVEQGLARRVRGGAVSLLLRGDELPFALREIDATDAKRRIAVKAAALVADGESVLIDSGTTAQAVAERLAGRRITAMALSLHAAQALASSAETTLLVPGGEVRPGELAFVGPLTTAAIASLRFDTAIVSTCGVTADGTLTAHDLGDAEVKRAALRAATRTVLVADGSKLGRSAMAVVGAVADLDVVVTDRSAPAKAVRDLRAAGLEVLRA